MPITIDKAIETTNTLISRKYYLARSKETNALKLGIEALKRVRWLREVRSQIGASKLLGETKE